MTKRHGLFMLAFAAMLTALPGADAPDLSKLIPLTPEQRSALPYPYGNIVPGGWNEWSAAMNARSAERMAVDNCVLLPAVSTFIAFEGRFPKDIAEVLGSDYVAVSGADLVDPLTGKRFVDIKPGDPLSEDWMVKESADPLSAEQFDFVRLIVPSTGAVVNWVDPGSKRILADHLAPAPGGKRHGYRKGSLPAPVLVARAVSEAVRSAAIEFKKVHGAYPDSFATLSAAYPFLSKLRNGFTGGYATLSQSFQEGGKIPASSPGDFVIMIRGGGKGPIFIVAAEGGRDADTIWPGRADYVIYDRPAAGWPTK